MVKATFAALHRCFSPRAVAARRGKKVSEIISRRSESAGAERVRADTGSAGRSEEAAR